MFSSPLSNPYVQSVLAKIYTVKNIKCQTCDAYSGLQPKLASLEFGQRYHRNAKEEY